MFSPDNNRTRTQSRRDGTRTRTRKAEYYLTTRSRMATIEFPPRPEDAWFVSDEDDVASDFVVSFAVAKRLSLS